MKKCILGLDPGLAILGFGTICYQSPKGKPENFLIGEDNVERGLHEGILFMKVGSKAKFISRMPAHR